MQAPFRKSSNRKPGQWEVMDQTADENRMEEDTQEVQHQEHSTDAEVLRIFAEQSRKAQRVIDQMHQESTKQLKALQELFESRLKSRAGQTTGEVLPGLSSEELDYEPDNFDVGEGAGESSRVMETGVAAKTGEVAKSGAMIKTCETTKTRETTGTERTFLICETENPAGAEPVATKKRRVYIPEGAPRQDLKIHFKCRGHPWKQDDDYILWKSLMYLEMEGSDCLWLVKKGVNPQGTYTDGEEARMRSLVAAYIMSNFPEKYQKTLMNCKDPIQMLEELDKMITPPSQAKEYALQIQFMNLLFNPALESVIDFKSRFLDFIHQIRRCPTAELTDSQIRRNLLSAISGVCPRIYSDAIEMPTMTVDKIFDRMFLHFEAEEEGKRREREGTSKAMMSMQSNLPNRFVRKRKLSQSRSSQSAHSSQPGRPGQPGRCYSCGLTGHWSSECRNPGKACYNCHQFGHISAECSKPATEATKSLRKGANNNNPKSANSTGNWKPRTSGSQPPAQDRLGIKQETLKPSQDKPGTKSGNSTAKRGQTQNRRERCRRQPVSTSGEKSTAAIVIRRNDGSRRGSAFAVFDGNKNPHLCFVADSGATEHMVNDASVFYSLRKLSKPIVISCANRSESADLIIEQTGDIIYYNPETRTYGALSGVLYAPELLKNLFSIRKLVCNGLSALLDKDKIMIYDPATGETLKKGPFDGTFWWLNFELPLLSSDPEKRKHILKVVEKKFGLFTGTQNTGDSEVSTEPSSASGCEPATKRTRRCSNEEIGGSHSELDDDSPVNPPIREPLTISDTMIMNQNDRSGETVQATNQVPDQPSASKGSDRLRDNEGLKWHFRLNHASKRYLEIAGKVLPELQKTSFGSEILDCAHCKMAKAKRKPFTEKRYRSEQLFHRLYSDLVGLIKPATLRSQSRYIVTFTDDASRYAFAYETSDKTKVHLALSSCLADIRKLMGPQTKVAELRSDGGLEFQTIEMKSLLHRENIVLTTCQPYTPQHNGTAERLNLELEEKIRVNLISSGVPTNLWGYAMRHVIYIHNRTPNSANHFKSPFEIVMKRPPVIKYIRRFGCEAYIVDNLAKNRSKFAPRANLGFLLECGETGYTLFHAEKKTIVRSKHVDFVEDRTYGDYLSAGSKAIQRQLLQEFEVEMQSNPITENEQVTQPVPACSGKDSENSEGVGDKIPIDSHMSNLESKGSDHCAPQSQKGRLIGGTDEFDFYDGSDEEIQNGACLLGMAVQDLREEPVNYHQAVTASDSNKWIQAINEEFEAIEECATWKLVPRNTVPYGVKIMKTRWVHKIKYQADDSVRYRSRLVVKGFADSNHYDLAETYAPVARLPDVRFILTMTVKFNLELVQLDIKTAFLNGSLDKLVYVEIPEGYPEYLGENDEFKKSYVCEVHRALYGLKVSPRRWYIRFLDAVKNMGFEPYPFQPCLFVWRTGAKMAVMLLYVDDILLASNCPEKLKKVKRMLENEFKVTDLGEPKKFLGMEITRDHEKGTIFLSQKPHVDAILFKYDPDSRTTVTTPMIDESGVNRFSNTEPADKLDPSIVPYRQLIGSLLYLQNGTRPDISYAVNILSRNQSHFTDRHWKALIRIVRYLRGTRELGLLYSTQSDQINCYVDASLGTNDPKGHSTTGYIIYLFGCPIAWRAKKQNHVALSSSNAEFIAMSAACRELANIRTMCKEILNFGIVPVLHEDSKPAMRLAEVDESSSLKHIVRLSYLYVREEFKNGNIKIEWIRTSEQIADMLTKPLSKKPFEYLRSYIMSYP